MTALCITLGILLAVSVAAGCRIILAYEDRVDRLLESHQRAAERQEAAFAVERAHIEAARAKAAPDLTELVALIDRLCQRVQAPEQAVVEHAMAQPLPPMPQVIEMDDDDAHWEAKEQMAEREMMAELREQAQAMRGTAEIA